MAGSKIRLAAGSLSRDEALRARRFCLELRRALGYQRVLLADEPVALLAHGDDDLAANEPLQYSIQIDGSVYRFAIDGTIRGREIHATATLPRACPDSPTSTAKWFAGFYFGGTSTAPSTIYGYVREPAAGASSGGTGGTGSVGSADPGVGSAEVGSSLLRQ